MVVVAVGTEQQQQERTFLQQVYDHAQRHTTPVVDEEFIKAFSQLSWEDQCRAMNHLYWIKQNVDRVINNHEEVVYKGRIEHLYKRWLEDQTEAWVSIAYTAPIEAAYWKNEKPENLPHVAGSKLEQYEEDPFLVEQGALV